MRHLICFAAVAAMWAAAGASAFADDQADAKALVEKAIKATGGADNISKVKAATSQLKGKFYGLGDGLDYTGEVLFQSPDKMRLEITTEFMGQKFKSIQVVNGGKGWHGLNDQITEMDKDMIDEAKEGMHSGAVTRLTPEVLRKAKLSSLGEIKVDGKPAVGVRVEVKDHRDVNLYFDKATHLLVKSETRGKDVMGGGGEFAEEKLYSDYKDVGGVKTPYKVTIKRDGKVFVEGEVTEYKPVEKIDEGRFGKP